MKAGKLRHRVYLQELTGEKDGSGHLKDEWRNVIDELIPAEIKGLTGNQAVSRSGEYADASHRVSMRFMPGVTVDRSLLFNARRLDILYVDNVEERDEELRLICRERIA